MAVARAGRFEAAGVFSLIFIAMINYRNRACVFLAAAFIFLVAALLSPHEDGVVDIFFLGLGIGSAAAGGRMFQKHRERKRFEN